MEENSPIPQNLGKTKDYDTSPLIEKNTKLKLNNVVFKLGLF